MRNMADFIADTYALGAGPWTVEPVTRGALGQIWKLSRNGSAWAVKELLFGCDEGQVRREAALRDASAKLGIASPRLLPNRDGAHVSRLGPARDGSFVKLYDWVDGTRADPSEPEILSWCGRTLALLHTAGVGAAQAPDPWYERCPEEADWARLHEEVRRAGLPWSDALGRFIDTSVAELAPHVTASGAADLVTAHLDVQPQNVLVGRAGPVLLDWDNAGPVSAGREFAHVVYVWSGGNHFDADAARRLVGAYREAGGVTRVKGLDSFSMLFATALNYVRVQAESAIDPSATAAQRAFASDQVVASLDAVPDLTAVSRLARTLEAMG